MRVLLITGNERRHRYVATRLAHDIGLAAIVSEAKPAAQPRPADSGLAAPEGRDPAALHLAQRDAAEAVLLGEPDFPAGVECLPVANGASNEPATFDWIAARAPDAILLYGCSIIRPPLLAAHDGRIINMHLGLSPYYRGAGTNFWPLVEGRPEGVGTTIHLATQRVDAGAILAQVRPAIASGDRAHEIGTKAIIAGTATMVAAARAYLAGRLQPRGQDLSRGSVYRRKDFTAEAVLTMWRRFDAGMIEDYLAERDARCAAMPIVEL